MYKLKCAVIGVGYLGRFHAQKYAKLSNIELIGVCDINQKTCDSVAQELKVPPFYDYTQLFGKVDAVSIAATTTQHFAIAKACIMQGIHVLIEKPITETLEQADELIYLAKQHQVKIQVGHMERFNPARIALDNYLDKPLFIESQRLAPYNPRGADVNVIFDVMIHDIDLIQSMVKSPIRHIDANGAPILSSAIDIANVRITFENQCVANITASRVSFTTQRKMRIFQPHSYLSVDYQNKQLAVFTKGKDEMFPGIPNIIQNQVAFENTDSLLEEIKAFTECITNNSKPIVSGKQGREALSIAQTITSLIQINLLHRDVVPT